MSDMKRPVCGKEYTDRDEAVDEGRDEADVSISAQHAYSLSELVKYFRKMIEQGYITQNPKRSDELTMGYCDELLEDLNG